MNALRAWALASGLVVTLAQAGDGSAAVPTASPTAVVGLNEQDFELAYQAFLADARLSQALRLARQAVQAKPADLTWRRRLAQVAEWSGDMALAWENWRYLLRQGDQAPDVLQGVLRLAPVVGEPELALQAWLLQVPQMRPTPAQWNDIRYLFEISGQPLAGSRFFEQQYVRDPQPHLLQQAAELAENGGDDARALKLYQQRADRAPFSADSVIRAAVLLIRTERLTEAHALLVRHQAQVDTARAEFWRLLGNVAWELTEETSARYAFGNYVHSPQATAGDWSRLIYLARQQDPKQAAELAYQAYRRYGELGNLLQALNLHVEAGDAAGFDALLRRLGASELARAEQDAGFLILRAQHRQRAGRNDEAWSDYQRALALPSQDDAALVSALWFLIDAARPKELEALLEPARVRAADNPEFWLPMAAAHHQLERYREALVWYRKEIRRQPQDMLLLLNAADLLQRLQQPGAALRIQRHAWARLREQQLTPEALNAAQQRALLQLALQNRPGDAAVAQVAQLLQRLRGLPQAPEAPQDDARQTADLILSWMLAQNQSAAARQWLWRYYLRQADQAAWRPPILLQSQLAVQEQDRAGMVQLLATAPERLPTSLRHDMARASRQPAQADTLLFDAMMRSPDDPELHDRWRLQVTPRANYVQLRWFSSQFGGLDATSRQLETSGVQIEARLTAAPGWQALLGWTVSAQTSGEPNIASYLPGAERLASIGLRHEQADVTSQIQLFQRDEYRVGNGLRMAHSRALMPRLQLDAALGWHQDATDSLPLRVAGMEDQLQLGAAYTPDARSYMRLAARVSRFYSQAGGNIGEGRVHDAEAGYRLRLQYPDWRLRVFVSQVAYEDAGTAAQSATDLSPRIRTESDAGRVDAARYFLSRGSTTWGACAGMGENRGGQSLQEGYSRVVLPFVDVCATQNSLNGGGYAGAVGLAGRLLGRDHLSLRLEQSSGGAGSGALVRTLALRYRYYF